MKNMENFEEKAFIAMTELVLKNTEIQTIECGHHHTLIIDKEYRVYYFGMGSLGVLGNNRYID
jgi:alpha-tubulin suppressor-like RCC1 family protein